MPKKTAILLGIFIFLIPVAVQASQPQLATSKIYATPFYMNAMAKNINHTFSLSVSVPNGISKAVNSIIYFQTYATSSPHTFRLYVNNQACRNPTAQAEQSGSTLIGFDCTNIITKEGNYTLILFSDKDIGATFTYLELSYNSNPKGSVTVGGTEYIVGDTMTVFTQLKDNSNLPVTNGACYISIYYPATYNITHPIWISKAPMIFKDGSDGLYYYDVVAPNVVGVYMVSATCSYQYAPIWFFSASDTIRKSDRTAIVGTYTGDTVYLNSFADGEYTYCDSVSKQCNAYYDFNTTGNDLSNATTAEIYFSGETSSFATATFYYWNWTSSAWVTLPNTLTFKGTASTFPTGSGDFQSNSVNITNLNYLINSTTKVIRVRIDTTSGTNFRQWNNWLSWRFTTITGIVQEVKGSGEIHISTSQLGSQNYKMETNCGEVTINERPSACAKFIPDTEFNLPEGAIEDNITITPYTNRNNTYWEYETPMSTSCGSVYHIKKKNETTGIYSDINLSTVTFASGQAPSGLTGVNCRIKIPINLTVGTPTYWYIVYDNYMKYKVLQSKVFYDTVNISHSAVCRPIFERNNYTATVPILNTTNVSAEQITRTCHYIADLLYWGYLFYDQSQTITTAGNYATLFSEISGYIETRLIQYYSFLSDYGGIGAKSHMVRTNCGDSRSDCAILIPDTEFNLPEGAIEDNITVYGYKDTVNDNWEYTTPVSISCGSVYHIKKKNETTGIYSDINLSTVVFGAAGNRNCNIRIPYNFTAGTNSYWYIVYDNYMKYKVLQSKAQYDAINNTRDLLCLPYAATNNYTYTVPILSGTNVSTDAILRSCHWQEDLLYWGYLFYGQSEATGQSGQYSQLFLELTDYIEPRLMNYYGFLTGYFINETYTLSKETINYLIIINGTTYQINQSQYAYYNSLLTAINSVNATANQTYSLLVGLNQSVFDLSQAELSHYNSIIAWLQSINMSLNTTLEYKLDLINGTVMQINESQYNNYLSLLGAIGTVEATLNGTIIPYLVDISGNLTDITQYLVVINGTTYQINQSQFVYYTNLLQAINSVNDTQNWQYLNILSLLNYINATGNATFELVTSINKTLIDDIFVILKDINFTTNTTLEYKLDLINYTTWQSWVMLQNLTIGNVSVAANVNWTEGVPIIWNTSGQSQIDYQLLSLSNEGIQLVVETLSCVDNTTLMHTMNVTNCFMGQCLDSVKNITETCAWGCANSQCIPQPTIQYFSILGVILLIAGITYVVWKAGGKG